MWDFAAGGASLSYNFSVIRNLRGGGAFRVPTSRSNRGFPGTDSARFSAGRGLSDRLPALRARRRFVSRTLNLAEREELKLPGCAAWIHTRICTCASEHSPETTSCHRNG